MKTSILHWIVSALVLMLVANIVDGFVIENYLFALLAAVVLGIVNAVIRPIMVVLTLPLTIISFGLFLFIVNAFMLKLAAVLVPGVEIFGFGPAILAALILAVLNILVFALVPEPAKG